MANDINIVVSAQVGDATKGLQQVQQQVQRVDRQIRNSTKILDANANQYNRTAVATNKWAKGALQQAGYQVGDFAVQLSGGQNALQAFGQQGSQLLGIFGPIGAVLGAGVAIFAAFGVAVQRSGAEVSEMGKALGVLQEPLSAVANTIKGISGSFGSAFPTIMQNIDTALIAAGLFAGFMVAKMVPSMIAASGAGGILSSAMVTVRASVLAAGLSAGKVSGAMVALKSAALLTGAAFKSLGVILMRFLPIAVLVGVAKLIEMFLQLRRGAGSFGDALGLLKDVAVEVFSRIRMAFKTVPLAIKAGSAAMASFFLERLANMSESFVDFTADVADAFNNIFNTNLTPLGSSMASAMRGVADEATASAAVARDELGSLSGAITAPLSSLDALRAAFAAGATDMDFLGDGIEEEATGGANAVKDKLIPAFDRLKAVQDAVSGAVESGFMSMVDGTKSVKDAFKSMASEIIKELYRIFVVKKITGMISGFIGSTFGAGMTAAPAVNPLSGLSGAQMLPSGARAMGGQVTGGKAYMVGERGPEMVVPSRNAHVVPSNQIGQGGVTVNQTINVSTGVQQTVRTEIKTLMPQIADAAKAAVVDAKLRGGSYGKAFG